MPTSLRVPKNCTGCSACKAVCLKNAIEMKEDVEGFLYPSVDSTLCVTCGFCNKICPVQNSVNQNSSMPELVAVIHKNGHVRASSSSGGAFFAIASSIGTPSQEVMVTPFLMPFAYASEFSSVRIVTVLPSSVLIIEKP